MNHVLDAIDAILAKLFGDDLIVRQRNAVLVHLAKATLVHQTADSLQGWVAVGNVGLHALQHVENWCVDLEEHTIADLAKAQQLQNLAGLGGDLVDTMNTNNEEQLGLWFNEEVVVRLGFPSESNKLLLCPGILLVISQST